MADLFSVAQAAHFMQFKKLKGSTTVVHKTIRTTGRVFAVDDENFPIYSPLSNVTKVVLADVGLISLNEPLPICERKGGRLYYVLQLPIADRYSDQWTSHISRFQDCKLLGYGDHERGRTDGRLRELNVSVHEDGEALVSPLKGKGRFCSGDSGGPLICLSGESEYVAVGIISLSDGLSEEFEPQCYGDTVTFTHDIFVDIREVLPLIKDGLFRIGKLNEFLDDNYNCSRIVHRT